jgi:uncharacterized protein YbcV (DUF1398 family)
MKDLKRQLQQMQKREEKLQEQLTALRGGTGTIRTYMHATLSPGLLKLRMGLEARLCHYCCWYK